MENLFGIDIPTRKRARRNWLVLLRNHGSDSLFLDMYLWYLDNMDSIPVVMSKVIVEEIVDAQERYTPSGGSTSRVNLSADELYSKFMSSPMMYHRSDYTGPVTGRGKWDRIGKPFVEDMVKLNAKIHFWNPAGKILGALSRYMRLEDWDDPERMLEFVLD